MSIFEDIKHDVTDLIIGEKNEKLVMKLTNGDEITVLGKYTVKKIVELLDGKR